MARRVSQRTPELQLDFRLLEADNEHPLFKTPSVQSSVPVALGAGYLLNHRKSRDDCRSDRIKPREKDFLLAFSVKSPDQLTNSQCLILAQLPTDPTAVLTGVRFFLCCSKWERKRKKEKPCLCL